MRFSYSWIRSMVSGLDVPAESLERLITMKTAECEGIETAQQHEEASHLGSDWCQGFYFAKPMHASLLEALLCGQTDGNGPVLHPRHRSEHAHRNQSTLSG